MLDAYCANELGPEKVLWFENPDKRLHDLEAIFELIKEGPDHPEKKGRFGGSIHRL
jgi:hypothetical protein